MGAMKILVVTTRGSSIRSAKDNLIGHRVERCMSGCRCCDEEPKEAILKNRWDVILFDFEDEYDPEHVIGGVLVTVLFAVKQGVKYVAVVINNAAHREHPCYISNVFNSCNGIFLVNNAKIFIADKVDRIVEGKDIGCIDWEKILEQLINT